MQQYELLAIFPGTLAEDEVATAVGIVKELIEKNGGTNISFEDLGKSRLAYPMKHIRYGYFRMGYFSAERSAVPSIQTKLDMSSITLRAIVRKYDPLAAVKKISQIMSDVAIASAVEEAREARQSAEAVSMPRGSGYRNSMSSVERKTESVPLIDIDKKLDEILESDLAKV